LSKKSRQADTHQTAIVCGGNASGDTSPASNAGFRARFPSVHSESGVPNLHLGYSAPAQSFFDYDRIKGIPDLGSAALCVQLAGQNGQTLSYPIGHIQDLQSSGAGAASSGLSGLRGTGMGMKIPPNLQFKTKDGALIKEIQEKGQEHMHNLLAGIPSHGAMPQMAGDFFQQMKSISTAKDEFDKVLSSGMLGQQGGSQLGNIGSMISGMMSGGSSGGGGGGGGSGARTLPNASGLSQDVVNGINSMTTLQQHVTGDPNVGSFATDNRVDLPTLQGHANSIIPTLQTPADINAMYHQLTSNTTLHGSPADVTITNEGAFGNVEVTISANGSVNHSNSSSESSGSSGFAGVMSSLPGASGFSQGMFKQSALTDMYKRLNNKANVQSFIETIKQHVKGDAASRDILNKAHQDTFDNNTFPFRIN
jgi:hypothetical protein